MRSRLTAHAVRDLRSVLRSTRRLFGPKQVLAYSAILNRAVALLVEDPHRPGSRARLELGDVVRSFHVARAAGRARGARHELFYALRTDETGLDELVVLRVLHDAMQPAGRVQAALREDLKRS